MKVAVQRPRRNHVTTLLLVPVVVLLGAGIAHAPILTVASLAAAIGLPYLVETPLARIVFLVFFGMAALGSSSEVTTPKVVYLLGSVIAIGGVILRLPRIASTHAYSDMSTVTRLSLLFGAFVGLETVRAIGQGIPVTLALRDAAPYLLLASVPFFALDARLSSAARWLPLLLLLAGGLATVAFVVEWVGRRGAADLPIDRVTLSAGLPAALFSYTSAKGVLGPRRLFWVMVSAFLLSLGFISGNRTVVLFLAAPIAIIFSGRAMGPRRISRVVFLGIAMALILTWLPNYLGNAIGIDTHQVLGRFGSLLDPSDLAANDQSFLIRLTQTRALASEFASDPLLGVGLGHEFEWTDPLSGETRSALFALDSPLLVPAKFGMIGVVLIVGLFGAYVSVLRRLIRNPDVYRCALVGFGVVVLLSLLLTGAGIEDKGSSLALILLLALSLPGRVRTETPTRLRSSLGSQDMAQTHASNDPEGESRDSGRLG
jgi:hypothetical protein